MQETRVAIGTDSIGVRWHDGNESELPILWLRDNCDCDECRVGQTSEKRFMVSSVPADLAPADVELVGDDLVLVWPDGHVTRYHGSSIRALKPVVNEWTAWGSDFEPRRCDFGSFLGDDSAAAAAIADFLEFGAVVLIDAPVEPGALEQLAPRLGPIREVLFARIHDVEVDAAGYNVAHTAMALPPHNDFASYSWPPSVQALHMLANDSPGGESIIVDGFRIVAELRAEHPEHFAALCATPVPFREFDDDNETYATEPMIRLDVDGNVSALRFSNQLMQAIPPGQAGAAEFYRAYHELCRRVTAPSNEFE